MTATEHGYNGYTRGCHCGICRAAKATYMRGVRSVARAIAQMHTTDLIRHVARGVTHGTRHAYDERGCRCIPCSDRARVWKSSPNGNTRKAPVPQL